MLGLKLIYISKMGSQTIFMEGTVKLPEVKYIYVRIEIQNIKVQPFSWRESTIPGDTSHTHCLWCTAYARDRGLNNNDIGYIGCVYVIQMEIFQLLAHSQSWDMAENV